MATEPTSSIWLTLVPVIVGGVIGVAGSFIGPWLIERKKQSHERSKKRAEKFEELVATVYEFDHYIYQYRDITAYGNAGQLGVSPMAKMQAIAMVHFPEFLREISDLDQVALVCQSAIAQAGQLRLDGKITEINAAMRDQIEKYHRKRSELLRSLKTFPISALLQPTPPSGRGDTD